MKILENNATVEVICMHCKSKLEINPYKDLWTENEEYDGVKYVTTYFYCPCCDKKNYVDDGIS